MLSHHKIISEILLEEKKRKQEKGSELLERRGSRRAE